MLKMAIASKDYRKYIEEKGIQISDWEMATLIYNNCETPYYVKMDALEQLARNTKDNDLKNQIKDRVLFDIECMQSFKESASNAYYRLEIFENEKYDECGIYLSYEEAYKDGLQGEQVFRITRERFSCKEKVGENEGVFGSIDFSKDGKVIQSVSFWKTVGDVDDGNKTRFERRSTGLPLLFKRGDIVKVIGRDVYGIVIAPKEEEEHVKMRELAQTGDYFDFQVPVAVIFNGKEYQTVFAHDHISPAHLEFAQLDDEDTRKGFLEYMSNTLKNDSWFSGSARHPERMEEILRRIETVWKKYPDMRLGQLLVNICGPNNLFTLEDEHLMQLVEKNRFGR